MEINKQYRLLEDRWSHSVKDKLLARHNDVVTCVTWDGQRAIVETKKGDRFAMKEDQLEEVVKPPVKK